MNYYTEIEQKRSEFEKTYKKFKTRNNIIMIAIAILVVVALAFLMPLGKNSEGLWASIIVIVVLLVVLMIYSRYMKKFINGKVRTYMSDYYINTTLAALSDLNVENLKQEPLEHLDPLVVTEAGILSNISQVNSRNFNTYTYKDTEIVFADVVVYTLEKRKQTPIFVGKALSFEITKERDNKLIGYRMPDDKELQYGGPTDIEELNLVEDDDKIRVYGKDEKHKLPKKVIDALRSIPSSSPLTDVSFSIIGKKVLILMSYNNDVMSIPLLTPFQETTLDSYKQSIEAVHKLIDELIK